MDQLEPLPQHPDRQQAERPGCDEPELPVQRRLVLSAGAEYKYNSALTLRAGIGYELSAVDDRNRTIYISDNDRLWLSAGASYQVTDKLKLDLGYTYITVQKASVNYTGSHPQQGAVFYSAEAKPYIHIVSAGLTYRWDNPTEAIPAAVIRKY